MNTITSVVGQRIRAHRLQKGLTQEELAERADLHPTYIGQVERGEKNLTLTSLEKLLSALNITFSAFFAHLETTLNDPRPADQCYELINGKSRREQERLYRILCEIDQLMNH